MSRTLMKAGLVLVALAAACAQDVGDVNRVQPNYLKKSDFVGVWYMRDTVVKVPSTTSILFSGYTGEMDKIRWHVAFDRLWAYRAYELIPGQDATVQADGKAVNETVVCDPGDPTRCETFQGAPVAAWAITSHFDIQREYNPATGEQTNVIVENTTDKPWYERAYMRVNWSDNAVSNYTQLASILAKSGIVDTIRYVGQADPENDPLVVETTPGSDGKPVLTYFDFTGRYYVQPLDCWFGGETDCTAAEVLVRASFYKVPGTDFEPLFYDDRMMSKFGYFRTERLTYDRDYGLTESGRIYLANRHNIWQASTRENPAFDATRPAGKDNPARVSIPLVERSPKPVAFYLTPGFPADLDEGAKGTEVSWNRAFRRAVAGAWGAPEAGSPVYDCTVVEEARFRLGRGDRECTDPFSEVRNANDEPVPQMYYVCAVPVTFDSPEACKAGRTFKRSGEAGDGLVEWTPRIGDVRYSFVTWIAEPQLAGPLGYGPSSADPETGEIVSANAFIYGAALDTYAQWSLDVVDILNGDLKIDELIDGRSVREAIAANRDALDPRLAMMRLPSGMLDEPASKMDREMLSPELGRKLDRVRAARRDALPGETRHARSVARSLGPESFAAHMTGLMDHAPFPSYDGRDERFAKALQSGPFVDQLMQVDEIRNAIRSASPTEEGQKKVAAEIFTNLSGQTERSRRRMMTAAKQSIWLAEFSDDAVAGLAMELKRMLDDRLAGIDPADPLYEATKREVRQQIKSIVRNRIYEAVTEHEVGHTVGLRHNFQGSFDSMNYFPDYWALRRANLKPLRDFGGWYDVTFGDMLSMASVTPDQRAGKMQEFAYSTVMDYGSRFNSDVHGLGKYDEAAILFAYAGEGGQPGPVETFNPGSLPPANSRDYDNTGFTARTVLQGTDARPSPIFDALPEWVHYTRLPELFGVGASYSAKTEAGVRAMYDRQLTSWADVQAARQATRGELLAKRDAYGNIETLDYLKAVNDREAFEVPYMFCSDEWVGAIPNCQMWDAGADYREQTVDLISRYQDYYWFNNFKRDRFGWSSYDVLTRVYERYFSYLPASYQHWLFAQYSGGLDDRQNRYWTLGVLEGYNLLSNVLAVPSDGAYGYSVTPATGEVSDYQRYYCYVSPDQPATARTLDDAAKKYCEDSYLIGDTYTVWLQRYLTADCKSQAAEAQPTTREGWLAYYAALPPADKDRIPVPHVEFYVQKGEGRPQYSRYDYNSGYFLFDKILESGNFWDQLASTIAMVQSQVTLLGVETASDIRAYSIPYYLVFSESVGQTFSGVYLEDFKKFAPRVKKNSLGVATGFQYRVPEALDWYDARSGGYYVRTYPDGPDASAPVVRPPLNWTNQIYAALYSVANFTAASWSQNFADINKIYRLGAGEQVTPNPGFEAITFNDPLRGHVLAALKPIGVSDPEKFPPAAAFIYQANLALARYEDAKARYDADNCDQRAYDELNERQSLLDQQVDFINVMRSLYDYYGRNF